MRILLVMNTTAGGAAETRVSITDVARMLAGHTLEVARADSPAATETAVRAAVAAGVDRVLVGGGDGTIHAVLPALVGSATALGILPVGTVNVLARELQIPLDLESALRIALDGTPRRIDLGCADGRPFALMAGLGFDARVVADTVPRLKELFGAVAYVTTGLQALAVYRSSQFHVTMDDLDATFPAWLMIVGNATFYAYELSLSPDARIDDGLLDVCIFAETSALDRLTQLFATFVGLHPLHPNVSIFRTHRLHVTAEPPVCVQLDGDVAGTSPVEIGILPGALTVMTP
jgi:YegS/Rv2252/BmrU family lipid kinase